MARGPRTFEELYREHGDRVRQIALRISGNPTDAEDLAQDVLILVFRNLHQFRGEAAFTTWLYRVTLHRWLRISRQRGDAHNLDGAAGAALASSDPMPARIERIALEDALAQLSEPLRVAVVLVKLEGFTHREAAEVLDVPQGTVQWRVWEGLRQLHALLNEAPRPTDRTAGTGQSPRERAHDDV